MDFDFSVFLNRDTLIFFAIGFVILAVIIVICFLIIKAIIKFIISFFKKKPEPHAMEGAVSDKGEDLTVRVEELEESKRERARVQNQQQPSVPIRAPVAQYNQPVSGRQTKEEVQIDKEDDKNQIEIPSKTTPNKSSPTQAGRMGNLRKDDIKISEEVFSKDLEALAKARASASEKGISKIQPENEPSSFSEKPDVLKNVSKPAEAKKAKEAKDSSIFGGKPEITRKELKYKLWKDPKVFKAAQESLLYLSPAKRAKLEKQLFPQAYGGNISKSDIRTRMHKLGQKMLSEKNPQAKAILRKEIKFIKKIGGIQ